METTLLIAMTYFIVKHFICDFPSFAQTPWMFMNKGIYGHPGGIAHAQVQAIASVPMVLYLAMSLPNILPSLIFWLICFWGEMFIHYHMDWFKMWLNKKQNWTPETPQFWTMLGVDQLVHYLSYVGILALWCGLQ